MNAFFVTGLLFVVGPVCAEQQPAARGSSQAWEMLIKRVYEVDPLSCPECGGQYQSGVKSSRGVEEIIA